MSPGLLDRDAPLSRKGFPLVGRPGANGAKRLGAVFLLGAGNLDLIYSPEVRQEIGGLAEVHGPPQTPETLDFAHLAEAEVIFSGWGPPVFDAEFLARLPRLRAVFYGAGSVRHLVTEAFWDRGIVISSAAAANAVPVAELALGEILLSLKHFWKYAAQARAGGEWGDQRREIPGCYGTTVGLVSFGAIARRLNDLLRPFDLRRIVCCPFLSAAEAEACGVERASLAEVFRSADVVSLHTPDLPETRGMISAELIASMKPGATLLNTARGAIIREKEMYEVLRQRPDLTAILDVTDPEPPDPQNPLLRLPNVIVTPHIAGSHHWECRRMGAYMLEEFKRFLAGEPLRWQVTREMTGLMA